MKEEIARTLKSLEEKGWITVNKHLNPETLADLFIDMFANMPLKKMLEIINKQY